MLRGFCLCEGLNENVPQDISSTVGPPNVALFGKEVWPFWRKNVTGAGLGEFIIQPHFQLTLCVSGGRPDCSAFCLPLVAITDLDSSGTVSQDKVLPAPEIGALQEDIRRLQGEEVDFVSDGAQRGQMPAQVNETRPY